MFLDINECKENPKMCKENNVAGTVVEDVCENTTGSYKCQCTDGYQHAKDENNKIDTTKCEGMEV